MRLQENKEILKEQTLMYTFWREAEPERGGTGAWECGRRWLMERVYIFTANIEWRKVGTQASSSWWDQLLGVLSGHNPSCSPISHHYDTWTNTRWINKKVKDEIYDHWYKEWVLFGRIEWQVLILRVFWLKEFQVHGFLVFKEHDTKDNKIFLCGA